jgi:hypothetical protein
MGLDFVEFVMALEAELGLRLSDVEVSAWRTVGDAVEHLDSLRPQRDGCPTQVTFHLVRRELVAHGGFSRRELQPAFDLRTVDRATWRSIRAQSPLEWGRAGIPFISSRANSTLGAFARRSAERWSFRLGFWTRARLRLTVRLLAADQAGWPLEEVLVATPFADLFPDG